MRHVSVFAKKPSTTEVMMTPLIDCVFLLLVYFLFSTSFRIPEHSLPGQIQAAAGTAPTPLNEPPPPEADLDEVVVRVRYADATVGWTLNDQSIASLAELRAQLSRIAEITRQAPVIVHPDPDTPLGHVIDTYDSVRLTGLSVAFATSITGMDAAELLESNP